MICQACGVEAPTKYVAFYQNIGCVVIRFTRSIQGNLCKSCIHKNFWSFTLINLALGWWGVISFIVTPFLILNNVFRYIFCLGMAAVPENATPPHLDEATLERLSPHTEYMISRLHDGEDFQTVAQETAIRAGATPGQVALYVQALVEAARQQ